MNKLQRWRWTQVETHQQRYDKYVQNIGCRHMVLMAFRMTDLCSKDLVFLFL